MTNEISIALFGLGAVGKTLLGILTGKQQILRERYGISFRLVLASDSTGTVASDEGLPLDDVLAAKASGGISGLGAFVEGCSALECLDAMAPDIVFEASPVDLKTGGIGLEIARSTLMQGRSIVFANKGPVVLAYGELGTLAREKGGQFRYSATVCGGLPVINIIERDLIAGDIRKVSGIFNSTTNFILDGMAEGRSYGSALQEAQRRGIAEADPSLDVEGWDTANKLVIIANAMAHATVKSAYGLGDVSVSGIANVSEEQVQSARKNGNTLKLVAEFSEGGLSVAPQEVPLTSFLGGCVGWEMGIVMESDIYGIMSHKLWEREPVPTAASMLRDAVHIVQTMKR